MKTSEAGMTLGSVLSEYKRIRIEDYQRNYSWGTEDIEYFLTDLRDATDEKVENHFFGTLIIQKQDSEKVAKIVDGQQRITTSFITIAAIRDAVAELSIQEIQPTSYGRKVRRPAEDADSIIYPDDNSMSFRFESNRFARNIMDNYILPSPDSSGPRPLPDREKPASLMLRHAAKQIRAGIKKDTDSYGTEEEKLARLDVLLRTLLEKFNLLRIETSDLNESLEVFLTINTRGQSLGPSDIVKGKIMSAAGIGLDEKDQLKLQSDINLEWEKLSEAVGEPEVFLRHALITLTAEKVQKKRVVGIVEKRMLGEDKRVDRDRALVFWQELKELSTHYYQIISCNISEKSKHELSLLEGLQKSHRIAILAAMRRPDLRENLDFMDRMIRLVFIISFKWVLEDKSRQGLEDFFQSFSSQVGGWGGEPNAQIPATERSLIETLENKALEIKADFGRYFRREVDGSFVVRAALYYIQRLTSSANLPEVRSLQLEHIAPQTSTPAWLSMFYDSPDKYDGYEMAVASAGNLTLLDPKINASLGNQPFKDKVTEFEKASLFITTDLKNFGFWNEKIVRDRTAWIAQSFEKICDVHAKELKISPFSKWKPDEER